MPTKKRNPKVTFVTSPSKSDQLVNWARYGNRRRGSAKPVAPHQQDQHGRRNAPNGNVRTGSTVNESQSLARVYHDNPVQPGGPAVRVTGRTSLPVTGSASNLGTAPVGRQATGTWLPYNPALGGGRVVEAVGRTSAPVTGSSNGAFGDSQTYQGPRYPDGSHRVDIHETPQFNAQTTRNSRNSPGPLSVDDIVQAVLAAAQGGFHPISVSAPTIDVGAVTAPYDQATATAKQVAQEHRGLIDKLNSDQSASVNQWSHEDAARLVRAKAAEIAAQKQALNENAANYKDLQKSLVAQGADPGIVAGLAAQAEVDHNSAKNVGAASVRQVSDEQGIQSAQAADRARANTTGTAEAHASLDDTLMGLVQSLNSQKADAASQANYTNQQNAAAAQQATAQQHADYMAQIADIVNGITQSAQDAKGDPTKYTTPGRHTAESWVAKYSADPTHRADDIFRAAIHNAPDEKTALDQLEQAATDLQNNTKGDVYKTDTKNHTAGEKIHPKGVQVDKQFLANMIHRYYATSGTLRSDVAHDALNQALARIKLLGLV